MGGEIGPTALVLQGGVNWTLLGIAAAIFLVGGGVLYVYLRAGDRRQHARARAGSPPPRPPPPRAGAPQDYTLEYDEALRAGDFARAAVAAKKLHDPRRYAEAVERAGDLERAIPAWIEAGEHHRAGKLLVEAGEHARAARLYSEIGLINEALDCFLKADEPEMAAKMYRQLGDEHKANLLTGEALARKKEHLQAARHFVAGGDMLKAAQQLVAAGDLPKAVEALRRAGRSHEAARLIANAGDHDAAAKLYEEAGHYSDAVRHYAKNGDEDSEIRCLALGGHAFEAGRRAFERQQLDPALGYLESVRPIDDRYADAALLRGQIYERRGDLKEAADAYSIFLEPRQPDERNKVLFLRVAQLQEGVGELQKALGLLGRMISGGLGTPDVTAWAGRLEAGLEAELEELSAGPPTAAFSPEKEALRQRTSRAAGRRRASFAAAQRAAPAAAARERIPEPVPLPTPVNPVQEADPPAIHILDRRYRFQGRMGQGGNGVVYRAVDRALGRNVVVKFLHQALLPTDVARKYFRREAKTAASLNHPNIVTIFDVGEEEGTMYFSMELVEGKTLADIIVDAGGRLTHKEIVPIVRQLASALDYAHARQIIHRDIKPGNIMVTSDGVVKLLDFGLAKALDENPDKSMFLCGTPFYMSPEQIRRDFLDHRTDVYSLGCLLYVLYTGDVPFPDGNVFYHQQKTPPPSPDDLVDDLPIGVGHVLLRAVEKDRERRWQKAGDVAEALAAVD